MACIKKVVSEVMCEGPVGLGLKDGACEPWKGPTRNEVEGHAQSSQRQKGFKVGEVTFYSAGNDDLVALSDWTITFSEINGRNVIR